jgi:hypothetical protein
MANPGGARIFEPVIDFLAIIAQRLSACLGKIESAPLRLRVP